MLISLPKEMCAYEVLYLYSPQYKYHLESSRCNKQEELEICVQLQGHGLIAITEMW